MKVTIIFVGITMTYGCNADGHGHGHLLHLPALSRLSRCRSVSLNFSHLFETAPFSGRRFLAELCADQCATRVHPSAGSIRKSQLFGRKWKLTMRLSSTPARESEMYGKLIAATALCVLSHAKQGQCSSDFRLPAGFKL